MTKRTRLIVALTCVSAAAAAIACPAMLRGRTGGGPGQRPETHWSFESEQDWIATSIVRAIANIASEQTTGISAKTRKPESGVDAVLIADVAVDAGAPVTLAVSEHIWAPAGYVPLARRLIGSSPTASASDAQTSRLIEALLTPTTDVLLAQGETVSRELSANLRSPGAHERAALLLGVLAIREAAGPFTDIRPLLGRITAHLAVAQALRGTSRPGDEGQLAGMALTVLVGRQRNALDALDAFGQGRTSEVEQAWTRALRLRTTEDWRMLPRPEGSLLEQLEGYRAVRVRLGANKALDYLERVAADSARVPDWTRITFQTSITVETGNRFSDEAIERELADVGLLYRSHNRGIWPAAQNALVEWLNTPPSAGPVTRTASGVKVAVIDEGTWAFHAQRHLAMQLAARSEFLRCCLGVPKEADAFDAETEKSFGGLMLYPLVRRHTVASREPYDRAMRAAAALPLRQPELVTMANWKKLLEPPDFAPGPTSIPTERRWFVQAIPAGTAFDSGERIIGTGRNPRLSNEEAAALREIAPFRRSVLFEHIRKRYGTKPTPEALERELSTILEYDLGAADRVAQAAVGRPDEYVRRMTAVCEMDPDRWGKLGIYLADRGRRDEAVAAFERWFAEARDRVGVSNGIAWLADEYLRRGNPRRAAAIAQAAGRVYSWSGLLTLARTLERTGYFREAESTYERAAERYDRPQELLAFYFRRAAAGDARARARAASLTPRVFAKGLERVTTQSLPAPAADGAQFTTVGVTGEREGLRSGDIVVAVDGVRVRDVAQYRARRGASDDPIMRLTVWRVNEYVNVAARLRHEWPYSEIVDYKPR